MAIVANLALAAAWIVPSNYASNENALAWVILGFMVSGVALIMQLVLGIVFTAGNTKKETGKGLLLATGICLLIGLSYCGILMM